MASEQGNQYQELASTGKAKETGAPPVRFSCPSCRMVLDVPAELAGVSGPCPGCAQVITSPLSDAPRPIEIKPRPPRPARGAEGATPPGGQIPFTRAALPIPALGTPPPPPTTVEAKPPVPRQPPIPPIVADPPRPETLEEQADWGLAPATRRRIKGQSQSRSGRSIVPNSNFTERHRNRQEMIAVGKIVLAVIATLVIAILIAKMTKRNILGPSRDLPVEDIQRPDYRP